MNSLRGSGVSGLKGIEPIRDNKYIRPIIEIEREEIEEYCNKNNLKPKYDETNNGNEYTRNKIRNIAIPYIKKEFNPNIIKTLNRLSEVAEEESEYLDKVTKQTYQIISVGADRVLSARIGTNPLILDLKKFNNLELVIKRRIVLYTIKEILGTTQGIEKINIDDIIKLCSNNIGNKYLTPVKNIKILVQKSKIFFYKLS